MHFFFLFFKEKKKEGKPTSVENVNKFSEDSRRRERGGEIKRSFAGMSETREDSREGARHCVCMIGCVGSEAFARIYECLF